MALISAMRRSLAMVLILALVLLVPASNVAADIEAWENGKAYTAMLEDAAKVAAAAAATAAAVAAAAAVDVATAKAAVAAAGGTAVATTSGTLAALAAAEAALASATAIAAATATAAAVAAAAVAAFAAGTYLGQGLRGLWHWCWDPVCDATAMVVKDTPIYYPASSDEVAALVPTLTKLATGGALSLTVHDFQTAGVSSEFVTQGAHMFIGASRGAAAATAGRDNEVLMAASELQAELVAYRLAIVQFSDQFEAAAFKVPDFEQMAEARAEFDAAAATALEVCNPDAGDDCVTIAAKLAEADFQLAIAENELASIDWVKLASRPLLDSLRLGDFQAFLRKTAEQGAAALPPPEIRMADLLLTKAGVYFPGQPSFGPAIAAYDALGDTGGREGALFNPLTQTITPGELLRRSATILSWKGPWLNIDLADSPLTRELLENVPVEPRVFPATGSSAEGKP